MTRTTITMMDVVKLSFFASLLGVAAVATAPAAGANIRSAPGVISRQQPYKPIQFGVTINVPRQHPGRVAFETEFGGVPNAERVMRAACGSVLYALGQSYGANKKGYTNVTLHLDGWDWMQERAAARAIGNQIHLSATYVDYVSGGGANPAYTKAHLTGVLYHEMTHVWQWLGAYGVDAHFSGLAEGMAEYVSIVSGYDNCGSAILPDFTTGWYEGACQTAGFLIYCASLRSTFVGDINGLMEQRRRYSDSYFHSLLRLTVDQLWANYTALPRPY